MGLFRQVFGLLRVRFRQVSLYHENEIKLKVRYTHRYTHAPYIIYVLTTYGEHMLTANGGTNLITKA